MVQYYNGGHILNNGCFINMSVGNRSTGKSFYFKRQCIKRYLKTGRKFIYLRRMAEDIKQVMPTWGDDIMETFPGYRIECLKNRIYLVKGEDEDEEREVCGYTAYLRGTARLKSVPMVDIDLIFYDEFLPDDNKYLEKSMPFYEPEMLMSLYLSVARGFGQVIRPEVQIVCVANNISMFNPYFTYFHVDLTHNAKYKKDGVYAERWMNETVANEMRKTHVGKFLSGTRYGEYALDNVALHDVYSHIAKPPACAIPIMCIYYIDWFTVYQMDANLYIRKCNDPTFPRRYKLVDFASEETMPWLQGDILKALQRTGRNDLIWYDSMGTKSIFAGIFM